MKQPSAELSDEQKAALYSEAKTLATVGTISAYERAVSVLSQLRGWHDSDRLATFCLQKIMMLQAQARQKRRKFAKSILFPLAAVALFAFLMFKFVFPDTRYGSSALLESYGSNSGMLSGTNSYSTEILPENGEASSDGESGNGNRTAMASGPFDPDAYSSESASGVSHPDLSDPYNGGGFRQIAESSSVSAGTSASGSEGGTGGGGSSSGQKNETGTSQHGSAAAQTAGTAVGNSTVSSEQTSGSNAAQDNGDGNIRSSAADVSENGSAQDFSEKTHKNSENPVLFKGSVFVSASLILLLLVFFLCRKLLRPALQYRRAVRQIRSGNYPEAIRLFRILNGYRDSAGKITYCETQIKDADYSSAVALKENGHLDEAIAALDRLGSYKDSEKHKDDCRQTIRDNDYHNAVQLMEAGRYEDAITAFRSLGGYKNSEAMILRCKTGMELEPIYREAVSLAEAGNRPEAEQLFRSLRNFRDSGEKLLELLDLDYAEALKYKDLRDFTSAISAFEKLADHRDSQYQIECCKAAILEQNYQSALAMKNEGRYEDAIDFLSTLSSHPQAKEQVEECKKLIEIPRPFGQYVPAQSAEKTGAADRGSATDQERTIEDVPFLDSVGTLTLTEENGHLKSAGWGADFFWKTQNVKNRGKSSEKQYRKFVNYYISLFGPPVSEYSTNGHKGAWWKSPSLTVDCSASSYIAIHFDSRKENA